MSKTRKTITSITILLLVASLSALFLIFSNLLTKDYVSVARVNVPVDELGDSDKIYYYWSINKERDDNLFYPYESPLKRPVVTMEYNKPNQQPETIYLHIKKVVSGNALYEIYTTKNYINKESIIDFDDKDVISISQPNLKASIASNGVTRIRDIYVQISDNALASNIPYQQRKYRTIFESTQRQHTKYDMNLNMSNANIGDGRYYLKIIVVDSANKETVKYSELKTIDYEIISRIIRFNTPTVGADGQIVTISPVVITGDSLVLFSLGSNPDDEESVISDNVLLLYGNNIDISQLSVRSWDNSVVRGIEIIPGTKSNTISLSSKSFVPNDWYYLYYKDIYAGVFLHQFRTITSVSE